MIISSLKLMLRVGSDSDLGGPERGDRSVDELGVYFSEAVGNYC